MASDVVSEDRELEALLNVKLEGLEALGFGDSVFGSWAPVSETPVSAPVAKPAVVAAPGEPFSRALGRMPERNVVYKATILKDYQGVVDQMRGVYDLICLGEMGMVGPVRSVAMALLESFRRDPQGLLALSLTRASSSGDYLYRHAANVGLITMAMATAAGHSKAGVLEAGMAALVADVGMRLVPEEILNKSGKLTEEELAEIHRHTAYSKTLLGALSDASPVLLQTAGQHHERLAGNGYPERRAAAHIIPEARMVGIADTLAAMVHKQSHREGLLPQEALERVVKMAQMNFLDMDLVKGLVGFLSLFPLGTVVDLGGGRIGRVVEAHPEDPSRPIVAVLKEAAGPLPLKSIYRKDLKLAREEKIVKCLDPEAQGFKPLDGF